MFGSVQGDIDPRLAPQLVSPHTPAVDYVFSLDFPLFSRNTSSTAIFLQDTGDCDSLEYRGAAHFCALGQCLGGVDGVGLAIFGEVDRAGQVAGIDHRPHSPRFRRRHDLHLETETLGHGRAPFEFLETRLARGDAQRTPLHESRGLPCFSLQGFVKPGSVLSEAGQVMRGT